MSHTIPIWSLRMGESWRLNVDHDSIKHAHLMKPQKISGEQCSNKLLRVATLHVWIAICRHQENKASLSTWKLWVWSPLGPRFFPLHLFLWLALICVLCYNKIVIIYIIIISWVMWVILPNYKTGESPWDSWIFSQLVWSKDGSGNPHTCRWCQKSWEDLVVWRTVPFTFSWSGWIWYAGAGIYRIWWLTGN